MENYHFFIENQERERERRGGEGTANSETHEMTFLEKKVGAKQKQARHP